MQAPFSTLQFVIPTGQRPTATTLVSTDSATVFAGANQNKPADGVTPLTVSLSKTANHDKSSAALIKFSLGTLAAGTVRLSPGIWH